MGSGGKRRRKSVIGAGCFFAALALLTHACTVADELSASFFPLEDASSETGTEEGDDTAVLGILPKGPDPDDEWIECEETECPSPCRFHVNINVDIMGDGLSWETAFPTIQEGINAAHCAAIACETPCQVWVATGAYYIYRYKIDNTVRLREWVELYGGFQGDEQHLDARDWVSNEVVLLGSHENDDSLHVVHVVWAQDHTRLDGFTVTGGRGPTEWTEDIFTDGENEHRRYGAGLYSYRTSPVIANCIFVDNDAGEVVGCGGGAYFGCDYLSVPSEPVIENCVFENNAAISGGAVCSEYSRPSFYGNIFKSNAVRRNGGAIYSSGGRLDIEECFFEENSACMYPSDPWNDDDGGAVYLDYGVSAIILDSDFYSNHAGRGGAICDNGYTDLLVERSTFDGNFAERAGAVMESLGSHWRISDSVFSRNEASNRGGAIWNINSNEDESIVLERCLFEENTAELGGAISDSNGTPQISNCVFVANSAQEGGAIHHSGCCSSVGNPVWFGNTFYGNQADVGGAIYDWASSCFPIIRNCIFWGNSNDQILVYGGGILSALDYSLVEGGYSGEGNVDGDPLFADVAGLDFHLLPYSPCIDAADGDTAPPMDMEGNPRHDDPATVNTGVGTPPWTDIGAFEFIP